MSSEPTDISLSLPVAGQTLQEGDDIKVYQYVINKKTTCKHLTAVLVSLGERGSGNRADLIARLEAFAQDKDAWLSLFRGERKRKRGNISGTRARMHSAKRINDMFAVKEQPVEYAYRHEHTDNRPIESISNEATAEIYRMVDDILRTNPPTPTRTVAAAPNATGSYAPQVAAVDTSTSCRLSPASDDASSRVGQRGLQVEAPSPTYQDIIGRNVLRRLSGMEIQMQGIYGYISNLNSTAADGQVTTGSPASPPSAPPVTSPPYASGSVPTHQGAPLGVSRTSASCRRTVGSYSNASTSPISSRPAHQPSSSTSHIPRDYKLTLVINGQALTFDARLVPDPPVRHFSKNIELLFDHWTTSNILSINGCGIPLQYWPNVYKALGRIGLKAKAWEAIKVEWGNWKFVVEARNSFGSIEAFWEAFTDENGSRLSFQAILNVLKDKREETDAADAQAARTFFGGDLDHPNAKGAFRYTKSGQSYLVTKPSVIAKKWKELLKTDAAVRQQYLQPSQTVQS